MFWTITALLPICYAITPAAPQEFSSHIPEIASLRLSVFREYPYLYEGTLERERECLLGYAATEKSVTILAQHEGRTIGSITGLPLSETFVCKQPFEERALPIDSIFYLGEIVVDPEHRRRGVGRALCLVFEQAVRKCGAISS